MRFEYDPAKATIQTLFGVEEVHATKYCPMCGQVKPLEEFHWISSTQLGGKVEKTSTPLLDPDLRRPYCKPCYNKYNAEHE